MKTTNTETLRAAIAILALITAEGREVSEAYVKCEADVGEAYDAAVDCLLDSGFIKSTMIEVRWTLVPALRLA